MTLLETAAHADTTGALIVGLIAFGILVGALGVTVLFGSARPHTTSK